MNDFFGGGGENSPVISVIIPVYNAEKCIQRCLDSIINNTYRALEIICIDDGSENQSYRILQSQTDSRIVSIRIEHRGVSACRNEGLRRSHGSIVAFIDADDWIHPQYFERLMNGFRKNGKITISCCRSMRCKEYRYDLAERQYDNDGIFLTGTEAVNTAQIETLTVWGKLYKREAIGDIRFPENVRFMEDSYFSIVVFSCASMIYACPDALYYYFQREDSASRVYNHEILPALLELLNAYKRTNNPVILEQIYKATFYYWDLNNYSKAMIQEFKPMIHECNTLAKKGLPLKTKMIFLGLSRFYGLYHLYVMIRRHR